MADKDNFRALTERATQSRTAGNLQDAGDLYTRAGYAKLSEGCFHHRGIWAGIDFFRYASVCYRVASTDERAVNRCEQAILQIEEMLNGRLPDDGVKRDAWKGLAYEYIGDFRAIAKLNGSVSSYERARKLFETVEQAGPPDPVHAWTGEAGFDQSTEFLLYLCDATDSHVDEETYFALRTRSLTSRIEFRLKNMQTLLSDLDSRETFVWSNDARKPPK